jgi:acyl-CoA hydrolase
MKIILKVGYLIMAKRLRKKTTIATNTLMVFPNDTNDIGTMYGGKLIEVMDMIGGICARRFSSHKAVTASIEDMQFIQPVGKGDIVEFKSVVIYTGTTSLIVKTKVTKEGYSEKKTLCARAYFIYVAIDKNRKPVEVPELIVETEKEILNQQIGAEIKKRQALEEKRFQIELKENL